MKSYINLSKGDSYIIEAYKKGYRSTNSGNIIGLRGNRLSLKRTKLNYNLFGFTWNNSKYTIRVCRFIAFEKFGMNLFKEGITVRHLDGNSLNDNHDNIDIGTMSENIRDMSPEKLDERVCNASSYTIKYDHEKVKCFYNKCRSYKKTMENFNISNCGTLHYLLNKRRLKITNLTNNN